MLCIVIVILRNPREIIGNFFIGVGRMLLGPLVPIFKMIVDVIKEIKFHKRKKEKIALIDQKKENKQFLHITLSEFSTYVLINGRSPQSIVEKEISEAFTHFEELKNASFRYRLKEGVTILEVFDVSSVFLLAFLTQYLSTDYGTDNIFGYLEADSLSLFFYQNPEEINEVIGQTSEGKTFLFSLESFEIDNSLLQLGYYPIKPKLSTDFFKQLIQSK